MGKSKKEESHELAFIPYTLLHFWPLPPSFGQARLVRPVFL